MPHRWLSRIFWIDGLSALVAGAFVLSLRRVLADLYMLPLGIITFVGLVNVAYSSLGIMLAIRKRRPPALVVGLAMANYLWSAACVVLVVRFAREARALGLGHILFEGLYVAALATVEWRNRRAWQGAGEPVRG